MMAGLTLKNVGKTYAGGVQAVAGVDLEVADGEFIVLVGPSGCGKSTLLRMVAGLEEISEGEVAIGGRVVNRLEPAARDIAMVFQNYALYPHMSVRQNIVAAQCELVWNRASTWSPHLARYHSISCRPPARNRTIRDPSSSRAVCCLG